MMMVDVIGILQGMVMQLNVTTKLSVTWPLGYKIFSMLNSAEHEIFPAY